MDAKQCMIVDLERRGDKRMFITEQVASISENKSGLWTVQFLSSSRVFNYNHSRLLYLTNPEKIDIGEKGLYIQNKHITNISELLRFTDGRHSFYRVAYTNGYYENLEGSEVYVTRTPIDKNGGSTWDYLRELAAETGLMVENDENILMKQYDLVDLKRDNVPLAQYLGDRAKLATYRDPKQIYYPFGCNASQQKAVQAAFENQISVVQGPPGTGKTTLAKVIANTTSAEFTQINATVAGKKDMEEVVNKAKELKGMYQKRTILFIDEIHRFNKGQQDYLLPFVEDGTIILIGATTENPYFEVNGALLSRSSVFELCPLSQEEVETLILRAVQDEKKGMGSYHAVIEEDALHFLADLAGGDARSALNAVERGILTTPRSEDGMIHITLDVASECIQKRVVRYDKTGDNHYDTISAFIKSMRGSDPDAAVYYLAKMLYAGEDIKFIARRIMICASEDVGNADPMALNVAVSAAQAVERIGMPEAQIILSQAVLYVATAPKSNSACNAVFTAMDNVKKYKTTVPSHLQDAHYKGAEKLGHGTGYKYAHDYPGHYVEQQYLPDEIKNARFYEPGDLGYEKQIKEHLQKLREQ